MGSTTLELTKADFNGRTRISVRGKCVSDSFYFLNSFSSIKVSNRVVSNVTKYYEKKMKVKIIKNCNVPKSQGENKRLEIKHLIPKKDSSINNQQYKNKINESKKWQMTIKNSIQNAKKLAVFEKRGELKSYVLPW